MKITKEELAAKLNGRDYRKEITEEEEKLAKDSGLFVLFGYSDDNLEVRGAQNDEFGAYDGGDFSMNKKGIFEIPEEDMEILAKYDLLDKALDGAAHIKVCYGVGKYTWSFQTKIPHVKFDIFNGQDLFCQGIIISKGDI